MTQGAVPCVVYLRGCLDGLNCALVEGAPSEGVGGGTQTVKDIYGSVLDTVDGYRVYT